MSKYIKRIIWVLCSKKTLLIIWKGTWEFLLIENTTMLSSEKIQTYRKWKITELQLFCLRHFSMTIICEEKLLIWWIKTNNINIVLLLSIWTHCLFVHLCFCNISSLDVLQVFLDIWHPHIKEFFLFVLFCSFVFLQHFLHQCFASLLWDLTSTHKRGFIISGVMWR